MTNLECQAVVNEELSRLRDIQRLLQAIAVVFVGDLSSIVLEKVIPKDNA